MNIKPNRKANRLPEYDYSRPGHYFVTLCIKNRLCLFGDIVNGSITLNDTGKIINKYWQSIPRYYPDVELDESVVMPNHIHGIIVIGAISDRAQTAANRANRPYGLLSQIIKSFKQITTKQIRCNMPDFSWQRSFYDHIIRNNEDLHRIREYIQNNPLKWHLDRENPQNYGRGDYKSPEERG